MTNQNNTVLYVGMTTDLQSRIYQHREKLIPGFTKRYNLDKLVYYEELADAYIAIKRKKQLKGGSRQNKLDLINQMNPQWNDLYSEL
jgi:putative endonuclease